MKPADRAAYVERLARALEASGESRITGRIYAHLATSDAHYMSLQQLADELGVSRGSVSMNTRRLIQLELLERVAVPGARGDHYGLTAAGTDGLIERMARVARELAALADEGVQLQKGTVTPGVQSLKALRETYLGMARGLEAQRGSKPAAR